MYNIVRIISPWAISLHHSEQGGLIIRTELIYEFPYISVLYLYRNFELHEEAGGLIIRTIR